MTIITAYWLALASFGVAFFASVLDLKRQRELHHGYWGLVLGLTCMRAALPALMAFPLIILLLLALASWRARIAFLALLALFAFLVPPIVGQIFALAMVIDDALNHALQVLDESNGRPARPDWTPIHKIGAWVELHLFPELQ